MEKKQPAPPQAKPKRKGGKGTSLLILLLVVIIIVLGFQYTKTTQELEVLRSPEARAELEAKQVESLVASVGRHILLPEGEAPTVATIVDAEALIAEQPFYRGSQNDDQVLIYTQSQQAIIYSPSRDIIVNVGPVIVGDQN